MAIKKDKKKDILEKIQDILKEAKSLVFVNFHGIKVDDINQIRGDLKKDGVGYYVAKKTLTKKAIDEAKMSGELPELEGEVAIAWSNDDETAPARLIYGFQKKLKEGFSIVGGVFEGSLRGKSEMMEIATIPSADVLRGMFVNVINSPIQGLVMALNQISEKKSD